MATQSQLHPRIIYHRVITGRHILYNQKPLIINWC